ncbi:MAG TPA: hypothetical protein DIU00_03930 [Phycisphaerales bacterium]|nr:hypothetical protein [Phycisphaerales bacterium]
MARTEFNNRREQRQSTKSNHPFGSRHRNFGKRIGIVIFTAVILLFWSAICTAGNDGPGIGFKIGAQTLESPIDFEKTTRARFELEVTSQRFCNDHLDLALTFGGSSLGTLHDDYAGYDGDTWVEESYSDQFSLLDLRLAGRLYPFGDSGGIQPYVGAGIGYFWFLDSWEFDYADTYEDPYIPGVFYTSTGYDEDTDTMAHGFFPFVTAGLTVPIKSNFELLFEVQYHYDKEDAGFDFGGPVYMFGASFRF